MKKKYLKLFAVFFLVLASLFVFNEYSAQTVLRIYDYQTKEIYVEVPAKEGDKLFFGWIHSWEKIPWHEYYHIDASHDLILDTIAFPAFGAGIPENKGTKVWIKDGMIYMGNINQARGATLPEHTRVNLAIVKRRYFDGREKHQ